MLHAAKVFDLVNALAEIEDETGLDPDSTTISTARAFLKANITADQWAAELALRGLAE